MHPRWLNENFYDPVTETWYCGACQAVLEVGNNGLGVKKEHLLIAWTHRLLTFYPHVLAKNTTGHTIEGLVDIPERVSLAPYLACNGVKFCLECLPIAPHDCVACGASVDLSEPHSEAQILFKRPDGYNHGLTTRYFHHDCLPAAFESVRSEQIERKSKIKE